MIPKAGKRIRGIKAVTARGMVSVIHHTAMRNAIAAVYVISGWPGERSKNKINNMQKKGINKRETFLIVSPEFV